MKIEPGEIVEFTTKLGGDSGLQMEDISAQVFGKYRHCRVWEGKRWAETEFDYYNDRPIDGAIPADGGAPYQSPKMEENPIYLIVGLLMMAACFALGFLTGMVFNPI